MNRDAYREDLAYIHHAGFGSFLRTVAPAIVALLRGAGLPRGARVVELGSGSGAATRVLTRAGFDVTGIEWSPAMIAIARRAAPGARFVRGSFVDAPIPACDAIVAVGEVLNYVIDARHGGGRRALERVFRRLAAALRPGGVLAFDALVRDASRPAVAEIGRAGRDWAVVVRRTIDRAGRRLVRDITTFRRLPSGAWRQGRETIAAALAARSDLAPALRAAGFRAVALRRAYGSEPPLARGHVAVVARRYARASAWMNE